MSEDASTILDDATRERIASLIASHDVVVFMKGHREMPQCGFSATVVRLLDSLVPEYATFDVLSDPAIREGIKEYSSWPTIPQLYVRGEFLGGCDIVQELHGSGELAEKLGVEVQSAPAPRIELSDTAAEALRRAIEDAPAGNALHLGIDARFRSSLFLAPVAEGEIESVASGVSIHMDPLSAARAGAARIDVDQTPDGPRFRVNLPEAPKRVRDLSVSELKQLLDAGERFEFIDVRTAEERAIASIPGTTLVNESVAKRLESLSKHTMLVFHCHHGGRSMAAAEHFASLGFTNVHNVSGGIDAWSLEIDPDVPRY